MALRSLKSNYLSNGYCLFRNFFSKKTISQILNDSKEIFNIQLKRFGLEVSNLSNDSLFNENIFKLFQTSHKAFLGAARLCQHTVSLHKLSLEEKLIEQLKILGLNHSTLCMKPILYFNSPHLSKQEFHYKVPAHQDWRSMQGSLDSIVVWAPLVDVNKELGALEIIPKSHLKGLIETDEDDWYRQIRQGEISEEEFCPIETKAGDALFFSSFLVHRSGTNTTNQIRWSVHSRYNNALEETFIKRNFTNPYTVYQPQKELITKNFPNIENINYIFSEREN